MFRFRKNWGKKYKTAVAQYIIENKEFIEGATIPVDESTSYEIDSIDCIQWLFIGR